MAPDDRDDVATAPARDPIDAGPRAGAPWARYQLRERLGEGGMGAVFAAFDPALDREIALKVLHDDQLSRAGQERLRREARALARVTDPNVVPVYDVGEHAGRSYYTMERVRGASLREWARTPRSWREVQRVVGDAARGLAAIHAAGLVHRDVKPGNVLIGDDGRARVADLGIAAGAGGPGGTAIVDTTTLRGAGTPAYMAPEQLDGALGDAAADQFALGVVLDELLQGRPPFGGTTVAERRAAIAAGPAPRGRDVPDWLDRVARRAMAEAPADRFADVAGFAAALAGPRPRRWPYAAGALVVLGGAAAVIVALLGRGAAPRCGDPAVELAGVWDDAARAEVRTALAAIARPYAAATGAELTRGLDAYAADWVAARAAACHAAASPLRDRRELCLARRRDQLRRVAALAVHAEAALIDRGLAPLLALEPVSDCSDPTYLAAVTDDQSDAARDRLARARTAGFAGDGDQAMALATEAVDAAGRAGDQSTRAEALIVRGVVHRDRGELVPAIEDLRAAVDAAGAGRARVDAWIQLGHTLLLAHGLDEAAQVLDRADAALAAAPDRVRGIELFEARGWLLSARGDAAGAVAAFEHQQRLAVDTYGPLSWQVATAHENLAIVLRDLDRPEEVVAHLRHAVELLGELGAEHPRVLRARQRLAQALGWAGHHETSEAAWRALLADQQRRYRADADAADVVIARQGHAVELHLLGRDADAVVELQAALASLERAPEPNVKTLLNLRGNLADTLVVLGRKAEAAALYRAVLDAQIGLFGPDHALVIETRQKLDAL